MRDTCRWPGFIVVRFGCKVSLLFCLWHVEMPAILLACMNVPPSLTNRHACTRSHAVMMREAAKKRKESAYYGAITRPMELDIQHFVSHSIIYCSNSRRKKRTKEVKTDSGPKMKNEK